jgi:hypothetical protein
MAHDHFYLRTKNILHINDKGSGINNTAKILLLY